MSTHCAVKFTKAFKGGDKSLFCGIAKTIFLGIFGVSGRIVKSGVMSMRATTAERTVMPRFSRTKPIIDLTEEQVRAILGTKPNSKQTLIKRL